MIRLGRYTLGAELGRGGMGVVHAATADDGRKVAVKVLLEPENEDASAMFEREKRLLWTLGETDGFVPVLDEGEASGKRYFVMPLLEGGTLRSRLARGPVPVEEAVAIAARVARALGRAHERGIVHRDLKPENILFTRIGLPLIADLGLAKHFRRDVLGASRSQALSTPGTVVGTAGYMAPEQLEDATSAGPAADVFALGAMLFECVAGARAFPSQGGLRGYAEALLVGPRLLRELRPDTPRWLEAVVDRAIARDPARRFADGRAFAEALAPKEEPPPRRRGLLYAGLGALGALVVAGVLGVPRVLEARRERAAALARDEGRRLAKALDFDAAVIVYSRAIELDPRVAEAWRGRAEGHCELAHFEQAVADARRAVELDPRLAAAWTLRGWARSKLGDTDGALADLDRAVELDPVAVDALVTRGVIRVERNKVDEALPDFERALAADPARPEPWLNRGNAKGLKGDLDGAIADLERGLSLGAHVATGWSTLANCLYFKGDNARAIAAATKAIALDPGLARAFSVRALCRLKVRDHVGARADCDRALALDPKIAYAWYASGELLVREGDVARAIEHLSRATELDPRLAAGYEVRGIARMNRGEWALAIDDLTRAIAIVPRSAKLWLHRGIAQEENGDPVKAVMDLEKCLDLRPERSIEEPARLRLGALRRR